MSKMTFEQFQATRRLVDDVGAATDQSQFYPDGPVKGYVYDDTWSLELNDDGSFHFVLLDEERTCPAEALPDLELALFQFATAEFPEEYTA